MDGCSPWRFSFSRSGNHTKQSTHCHQQLAADTRISWWPWMMALLGSEPSWTGPPCGGRVVGGASGLRCAPRCCSSGPQGGQWEWGQAPGGLSPETLLPLHLRLDGTGGNPVSPTGLGTQGALPLSPGWSPGTRCPPRAEAALVPQGPDPGPVRTGHLAWDFLLTPPHSWEFLAPDPENTGAEPRIQPSMDEAHPAGSHPLAEAWGPLGWWG